MYCWVLLLNIEECVKALDNDTEQRDQISRVPADMKFTDQNEKGQLAVPRVTDLAVLTDRMGDILEKLSKHMNNNATVIKTAGQKTATRQVDIRARDHKLKYRIKHVFDGTRYLSAMNQILACMIIPLGEQSPRYLAWRPNPVQRRPNVSSN